MMFTVNQLGKLHITAKSVGEPVDQLDKGEQTEPKTESHQTADLGYVANLCHSCIPVNRLAL